MGLQPRKALAFRGTLPQNVAYLILLTGDSNQTIDGVLQLHIDCSSRHCHKRPAGIFVDLRCPTASTHLVIISVQKNTEGFCQQRSSDDQASNGETDTVNRRQNKNESSSKMQMILAQIEQKIWLDSLFKLAIFGLALLGKFQFISTFGSADSNSLGIIAPKSVNS